MKNNFSEILLKGFGFLYFAFYCCLLPVMFILSAYSYFLSGLRPGGVVFLIPALGALAGYGVRKGRYGFWRSVLISLGLVISAGAVCLQCFIRPVFSQAKALHEAEAGSQSSSEGLPILNQRFVLLAREGSIADLEALLEAGAQINACNQWGETGLHLVRAPDVARFLIEKGADVNSRDFEYGMTPLFFHEEAIARLLIEAGADVNARSHKGNTPLIWYAYSGYEEGIRYLISQGADLNAVNDDGNTALDIAERFGHIELAAYLASLGASSGKNL